MDLKIEYVKPSALKEYKNNAREHHDNDVNAIAASIKEFGFNDPIGVWHDEIVEGHGRLLAAIQLKLKKVPIIRLDDLTDEQRKAYALAHNKTAELSNWNFDILDSELQALSDFDMSQFGFNADAVEEPKERKDKSGDIGEQWQVIVDCADETEQEEIFNRLMGEGLHCRALTL